MAASGIVLCHAECRSQNEGYRNYGADHRQVMLKIDVVGQSKQPSIFSRIYTHLERHEQAEVPRWHIVDPISQVRLSIGQLFRMLVAIGLPVHGSVLRDALKMRFRTIGRFVAKIRTRA